MEKQWHWYEQECIVGPLAAIAFVVVLFGLVYLCGGPWS